MAAAKEEGGEVEKAKTGQKIASVEWLRLFAAVCVVLYHFQSVGYGRMALGNVAVVVDFFFMLSGFLLMKHAASKPMQPDSALQSLAESLRYVFRKLTRFYPAYLLAFFMVFVLTMVLEEVQGPGAVMEWLFHYKWEAVLLQMAAFTPNPSFGVDYLVGSAWYLSSMLLMMIPVYYLAVHHRRLFTNLIAPLAVVFLYGFIMQQYGSLDIGNEVVVFTLSGNLRALAGLSLGCLCYVLYANAQAVDWGKGARVAAAVAEIACLLSLIGLLFLGDAISSADVLFWVPVFGALLFFGFSDRTPVARVLNRRLTKVAIYLGQLSLYLYLFHWFFVLLFSDYFEGLPLRGTQAVYFVSTFLFSALAMWFFGFVKRRTRQK